MIERTFKTTGGSLRVRIPTLLSEITMGQMIELQEMHYLKDVEAISILSGIPKEDLYNIVNYNDFEVLGVYVRSLGQQVKYLYNGEILPRKVTFMLGKRKVDINVIHNLSVEPAGALLAARDIIADEINLHINLHGEEHWKEHFQPSLRSCCHLLAQYFFCRATGKRYDEYEADEFNEEIKKLKVTEALPIAKYFFSSYPDLLKQKLGLMQRLHHYWRRRQVLKRLKNPNT